MTTVAHAVLSAGAAGRTPLRRDVRYAMPYDPIELAPTAAMRYPHRRRPHRPGRPGRRSTELHGRRGTAPGARHPGPPARRARHGARLMTGSISELATFVAAQNFHYRPDPIAPEQVVLESYTFLPYVRSGVAAVLSTPFDWSLPSRSTAELSVPVEAANCSVPPMPP